ncbi:solute carrier family 35 member F1-like [Cynara cardunculus var. scolymus]|uniref:solute carrier family 35 member F1-like n=1 Tax=Cynara cardunculus var. scolymus TaxID=59895 RepID=UPI000D62A426|nr:solute carrier family 35 member F1-like [Cynara cardunculus var. scolymus]
MVSVKEFLANKTVVGLLLGQILSLLITSTGFSSSELARRGINAPTSQSLANYVMLAVVYGGILIHRGRGLKAKWYYYLLLGLVDVEANYLVVKAYQYTSITSIMLLDCWSIPSVILLTWLFLKTKYRFKKIAGVAICVAGLVLVIFSDVHAADRSQNGSSPIKGDFLVVAGATLYAVSNVSEEFFVTTADRIELMAMLGFFGAIVSGIQITILEREELKSIHWSSGALLPYTGFAAAMFLFYSGVPVLLKMSGSTMLNLSLLTSDMWSVLIRIFAYHEKVDWMYFVAFAAVAVGLVVYSGFDKETRSEVADGTEQSKYLDEEAGVTSSSKPNVASSSSNKHEFASTSKTNTESSIYKGKDSPIKKI